MDRLLVLLLLGVGGIIAWRKGWLDRLMPIGTANAGSLGVDFSSLFMAPSSSTPGSNAWIPPAAALPYLAAIRAAEKRNGLPTDLLTRVLDQESKFRADIIEGRTSSRVGARGIAQVMPSTAASPGYGVPRLANPLDPWASIEWAAQYLAALRKRFGNWAQALAAYNFGPGNVIAGATWPTETRNYVASITRDIPVA